MHFAPVYVLLIKSLSLSYTCITVVFHFKIWNMETPHLLTHVWCLCLMIKRNMKGKIALVLQLIKKCHLLMVDKNYMKILPWRALKPVT
jgi:hypothetical protein